MVAYRTVTYENSWTVQRGHEQWLCRDKSGTAALRCKDPTLRTLRLHKRPHPTPRQTATMPVNIVHPEFEGSCFLAQPQWNFSEAQKQLQLLLASDNWRKRSTASSITSLPVDEERTRPGHWFGSVLYVSFTASTLLAG